MVDLSREAYRDLSNVPTVTSLIEVYRQHGGDRHLWERAKVLMPALEPARACRVARDAAYFRRYRELLDGRFVPKSTPKPE